MAPPTWRPTNRRSATSTSTSGPAPGGPWCAPARARTRRRDRRALRPAYRAAAPGHREADGKPDLPAEPALLRPARLRGHDEPGTRLVPRDRKADGRGGAAPGAAHPRALLRDRAHPEPPAERDHAGHGRGRADPAALGLRGTREADGLLRAGVWRPAPRRLFPARRRASGPAVPADRRYRHLGRRISEGAEGYRWSPDRKPHLQAAQRRYRRCQRRGHTGLGHVRRHGARLGLGLGPAPRAAL